MELNGITKASRDIQIRITPVYSLNKLVSEAAHVRDTVPQNSFHKWKSHAITSLKAYTALYVGL